MSEIDSSSRRSLKVGIVGCGLSGLATAVALKLSVGSFDVKIYEKDSSFESRRQGYGMTLTNSQNSAIAQLGLSQDCENINCISTCHYIFSPSGHVRGYYGRQFIDPSQKRRKREGHYNLRISRQNMRSLLLKKLMDISNNEFVVEWGTSLLDYNEHEDRVDCRFLKGGDDIILKETFDILVGSDGIRSHVRDLRDSKLGLSCPLRYLNIAAIIGLSPYRHALIEKRGFYVIDGCHRLFVMPFSDELTMWQLSFSDISESDAQTLRSAVSAHILEEARRRVCDWFHPVEELIKCTDVEFVWATPIYDRDPMNLYHDQTRVVVIGDAAHPMSMFKGQGANQAMNDGPLLAKWLAKDWGSSSYFTSKKILTKTKCFEREMVAKTAAKVLSSREAAQFLHSPKVLDSPTSIEGISPERLESLVCSLAEKNVTAADDIDGIIENILCDR